MDTGLCTILSTAESSGHAKVLETGNPRPRLKLVQNMCEAGGPEQLPHL